MPRASQLLVGLSLVAVLVAGCSSPRASAAQTTSVDLPPSYTFAPAHISVAPGSTVTWTNHDHFSHTVQVDGQPEVHFMRPGESTQITMSAAGEYHYVCTLHTQNMQGTITVA
jgi:plastocyanin